MIQRVRNSFFLRFFWGFMCLYMLNLSVDAPNPEVVSTAKSLSFNDRESFIEILLEQVMGFENSIVEFEDNDTTPEQRQKKTLTLDFFLLYDSKVSVNLGIFNSRKQKTAHHTLNFDLRHFEIHSPPPEA